MIAAGGRPSPEVVDAVVALALRAARPNETLVLGINGPQGAGKSTLAAAVVDRARAVGQVAVAVSIDDFYLTRAEQLALAAHHPGNRYLEHRGYPGTHDVALGARTIRALRSAGAGDAIALPRYDKGAHDGRGDRAHEAAWPRVTGPVDLVVFEGWMLGFPPVDAPDADADLAVAAGMLGAYEPWRREIDAFVHLEASDVADIVEWRVDAERARRSAGAPALSDEAARDYIARFLPAYGLWVPALRAHPPRRDGGAIPSLWIRWSRDRGPAEIVAAD